MATQTTGGGSTASFSNTPQAKDDYYAFFEDLLRSNSTLYNVATHTILLDVMSNDLGGNAKTLFSVEDGDGNPITSDFDLLAKDVNSFGVSPWEATLNGNWVRINNGKIEYRIADGSGIPGQGADVNSLNAGQVFCDEFVYAIRLGNGTLSEATVKINITGANDNALIGGDNDGAISEDAAPNTVSGVLVVTDADAGQNELQPIPAGTAGDNGYGSFQVLANGNWTYTLNNADPDVQALAAGEVVYDTITVTSEDGTDTEVITVTITGTNDEPVATDDSGSGNEDTTISGSVAGNDSDVDLGATLSYAINGAAPAGFSMDGDGNWSLDASNLAYQHLAAGASEDVVVSYTVTDEHGDSDTATLTITVHGVNDAPEAEDDVGDGNEDSLINGSVATNDDDVDDGATLSYAINGAAPAGFSMLGDGSWSLDASDLAYQHLAAGASEDVVVSYTVTDEHGDSDTATLTITVHGVNDAPEAEDDNGDGNEDSLISGSVATNDDDADDGAVLSYAINGAAPAGFGLLSDGSWSLDASNLAYQHLAVGASEDVVVSYTVTDEHGDSDTATLTITVHGVNDAPEAEDDTGDGNEDSLISGSVATNDDDLDDGATLSYVVNGAAPAGFSMDGAGNWSLDASNLAYQHIAQGATQYVVVSYTVTDEHGESDIATLTITVHGVNDDPALTGAQATLAAGTEDQNYIVSKASLLAGFSDVDDGAVLGIFGLTANHGSVIDNGDGTYTIVPEANYNGLVTLSYSVVDGLGGSVAATNSFTLAPVNDPAVITGTDSGSVVEAGAANGGGTPAASGTLLAADVDNPPNTFIAVNSPTLSANGYGSFTMTAGGTWTFTLNNANATVNALAAGVVLMDSFTVQSADGTTKTISITITGADDVIVVTPPAPFTGGGDPNDFDGLSGGAVVSGNFTATNGNDTFTGDGGNQTLNGQGGNDTIYGAAGNDNINGNNDNDTLYGQVGDDNVSGNNGLDTLYGGSGNDTLTGGNDGDSIYGGSGADIIDGSGGNDIIYGGYGADTLTGGNNDDTFVYLDLKDTNDSILDFMDAGNDQIDLSALDANSAMALNQVFGWGGNTPTANSLWFAESGGDTTLYGDTDGNVATAEFMILLPTFTGFNAFTNPLTPPPDITF